VIWQFGQRVASAIDAPKGNAKATSPSHMPEPETSPLLDSA
jgi:hypothetical protein